MNMDNDFVRNLLIQMSDCSEILCSDPLAVHGGRVQLCLRVWDSDLGSMQLAQEWIRLLWVRLTYFGLVTPEIRQEFDATQLRLSSGAAEAPPSLVAFIEEWKARSMWFWDNVTHIISHDAYADQSLFMTDSLHPLPLPIPPRRRRHQIRRAHLLLRESTMN